MDLVGRGAAPELVAAINQAVQGQAVQSHFGETVTATQIKIALDAAANQAMLGCDAEACMTSVGRTVEASLVLGGQVTQVGSDVLITLVTVNARDGARLAQQERKVPMHRELYYYAARQLASLVLTGRSVDPRVPVRITVTGAKGDPTIIVDGKEVARALETTVQLDPGSHDLLVRNDGKVDWRLTVNVEEATPMEVTGSLVSDRLDLWPIGIASTGAAVVVAAVAVGFGLRAQDTYEGSVDLPLPFYDVTPETSYQFSAPTSSQLLYTREQETAQAALAANILYGTAGVLVTAGAGMFVMDLLSASGAE